MKRVRLLGFLALAMVVGACEGAPKTATAPEYTKWQQPLRDPNTGEKILCVDNAPCVAVVPGPDIAGGPVYGAACKKSAGECIALLDATKCVSTLENDPTAWPALCGGTGCLNDNECDDGDANTQDKCLNLGWTDFGLCYHPGTVCFVGKGECVASGTWELVAGGGTACSAIAGIPTEELCDGYDNDCDGVTDEDNTSDCVTYYTDVDADGHGVAPSKCMCAASEVYVVDNYDDCNDDDHVIYAGAAELCDNKDNDCNGQTDEAFPTLGQACTDGTGECFVSGAIVCSENGLSAVCSVNAKTPQPEICDDKDNDCDGLTDEGCDDDGDGWCDAGMGAIGNPVACPNGGGDCNDGNTDRFPGKAEACNALDDDCDGATDEGFNLGQDCTVGVGACANSGVLVCAQDGLSAVCSVSPKESATEKCDNIDNDCDGLTDEGCDDDNDDWCDNVMQVIGTPLTCQHGDGDCDDTTPTTNAGAAESCNGVDDNCDGVTDEGFDLNAVCSAGTGECKSWGAIVCATNGTAVCDAVAKQAGTEICDGKDNNCDGVVDDGDICSPSMSPVKVSCGGSVALNTGTDLNAANNFTAWEVGTVTQSRQGKEMVLEPQVVSGQTFVLTCTAASDSPTKLYSYTVYLLKSLFASPDKDANADGVKETGSKAMVASAGTKSVSGTGGTNKWVVLDTVALPWKGTCALVCSSMIPD